MLRVHGIKWAVALVFVCFAAQGVSSASISSRTANHDDVYSEEYQLTNALSENLLFSPGWKWPSPGWSWAIPNPPLLRCSSRHIDDIKHLTSEAAVLAKDIGRIGSVLFHEYFECGLDINCKMSAFVKAFSELIKESAQISFFLKDLQTVATKIRDCIRESKSTPAPPTTQPPTSTITPSPTTHSTTTPSPTTHSTTTPSPTTHSTNTPSPTTHSTTTPSPTTHSTNTPPPTTHSTNTPSPTTHSTTTSFPTTHSTTTPSPTTASPSTPNAPQPQVDKQPHSEQSNKPTSGDKNDLDTVPENWETLENKNGQELYEL